MIGKKRCFSITAVAFTMGLVLSGCQATAQQKQQQQSQVDRESYSLGYQVGQNLKSQKVQIDLEKYVSGIRDALGAEKPEMSQEEIRAALAAMSQRLKAAAQAEFAVKAEKKLAESRAFLEENKINEGIIVLPSGLQYRVVKEGTGRKPKADDTVTVNYRGTFPDGTEFASSYKQEKATTAALSRSIRGWSEGLQLMKEGSKYQLFIPAELAYGQIGAKGVEPNSTLIFDVELISVTPATGSPTVAAKMGAKNK